MPREEKATLGPERPTLCPTPLAYHTPLSQSSARSWLMWSCALLPFFVVIGCAMHDSAFGDPPESLGQFKAYHYPVLVSLFFVTWWVVMVCFSVRRGAANRLDLLLALTWCAFVWWLGLGWLVHINAHPAADFYWSQWRRWP